MNRLANHAVNASGNQLGPGAGGAAQMNNSRQLAVIHEDAREERKYEDSLDKDIRQIDNKS